MAPSPETFGHLLTEAVYRIRSIEAKSIAIVQDELGYTMGRETGGSAIEYWRKNHVPTSPDEVEQLAREIVRRTDLSRVWIEQFLKSTDYPRWRALCDELFPPLPPPLPAPPPQLESYSMEMPLAPFVAGPPIMHCRQFFGREDELRRIFGVLGRFPLQHIAVIGPQRSGKTSLLHYLKSITRTPPQQLRPGQRADWLKQADRYRWVFVDFQDPRMCGLDGLLPHLLAGLHLPIPARCTLSAFMDVASRGLHNPAVILLDEIGSALESPELDLKFWWSLRSLCTNQTSGHLGVILTSQQPPMQQAHDYEKPSPFFNIFHRMDLGPLTEPAARALIANSPQPFADAEAEWILEQSGGWPVLLQILCSAQLEALERGAADSAWREEGLYQIGPYRYLLDARERVKG
ncbi:MAG: ATP-binding protein [Roseiflexaceae bacterium]